MQDTESSGRIDIMIFPNGGKEVIGRVASYPKVPESTYWPEVLAFVAEHQGLEKPVKYTGRYSVTGGVFSMQWFDWAGEIERPEEDGAIDVEPDEAEE